MTPSEKETEKSPPAEQAEHGAEGPAAATASKRVQGFDFQQPSHLPQSDLEKLKRINEPLLEEAERALAKFMGSPVDAQMGEMDQLNWEHLIEEFGEADVGFDFQLKPHGYVGLLSMDRKFASSCLERMMGAYAPEEDENSTLGLTELDARVLGNLARILLAPLSTAWDGLGKFQVELGAFRDDLKNLALFKPHEPIFRLNFDVKSEAANGRFSINVPFQTVKKLSPESGMKGAARGHDEADEARLRDSLNSVPVELIVLLGAREMPVRELISVQPGDVVVLNTGINGALDVRVNDKVKFRSRPGVYRGQMAVKLIGEEGKV